MNECLSKLYRKTSAKGIPIADPVRNKTMLYLSEYESFSIYVPYIYNVYFLF